MPNLAFEALGTAWSILIDAPASELSEAGADLETLRSELIALTDIFDHRFSRFKPDTEATAFRHADSGTYPISPEFTQLLARSDVLRQLTDGAFDPAVGGLLEAAGYDPQYQLKPDANSLATWKLPNWSVNTKDHTLTIDGPVVFDIGGTGKGYWIDVLSQYLLEKGFTYHLVEGGGDMKATTKANGDGYTIALEWPGRPDMAIGVVTLKNQGLAASDVFKRQWQNWNHLVNVPLKQPVQHVHGCIAVAESAWRADEVTSVLALSDPSQYLDRVKGLEGEYVVVLATGEVKVSTGWPGELF